MARVRTAFALCIACALIVSAFAAQSASAETTAFTCTKTTEQKTWSDVHCGNSTTGTKEYGHVTIPENTTTEINGEPGTSKPSQRLKATINGINTELVTTTVHTTGVTHNVTVNGKMQSIGTGTMTFTNISVATPAGKGCKVYTDSGGVKGEEGVVHTNELVTATTEEMGVKVTPAEGSSFGTFIIDGCTGSEALEGLNKTYEITGSVIGEPNAAETVFTHTSTTTQNTLKLNGSIKLGIDGAATIQARHEPEDPYKAVVVTTPEGGVYKEDK